MKPFKDFLKQLKMNETVLDFNLRMKDIAKDCFDLVSSCSEPKYREKKWMIFNSQIRQKYAKKSLPEVDLWVQAIYVDQIPNDKFETGFFGKDSRANDKPYIKILLLDGFDPTDYNHRMLANDHFTEEEIRQVILHELTHLSDHLSGKEGEDNLEFRANLTNFLDSCRDEISLGQLQNFIDNPSPANYPRCVKIDRRLQEFLAKVLNDNEKKDFLLNRLRELLKPQFKPISGFQN